MGRGHGDYETTKQKKKNPLKTPPSLLPPIPSCSVKKKKPTALSTPGLEMRMERHRVANRGRGRSDLSPRSAWRGQRDPPPGAWGRGAEVVPSPRAGRQQRCQQLARPYPEPSWGSLLFFLLIEGKNAGAARQTLFFFLNGSLGVQISSFSSPAGTSRAVEGPKRTQNEAVCRVRSGAVQPHCPRPSSSSSSSASSSSQPAPRLPPPPLPFSPCHFSPP